MDQNVLSTVTVRVLLFAFLSLVTCSMSAVANPCVDENDIAKTDGACWNALSPLEKNLLVRGEWAGREANNVSREMIGDARPALNMDWLSAPAETTIGDVTAYIDKLYKTPANRQINWSYAFILAALDARDDDSNDASDLIVFLRAHGSLPTSGTLLDAAHGNTLKIKTDNGIVNLRLASIAAGGKYESKANDFIRGLRVGGNATTKDCSVVVPTTVSIEYGDDLFDENNELTGYARISAYPGICAGTQLVTFGEASRLNLNFYLLSHGLTYPSDKVDPKWDKNRQFIRDIRSVGVDLAKKDALYLYGEKIDDTVETVAKAGAPQ